jgi:hypothetical protein
MRQTLEISDLSTHTGDRLIQLIRESQMLLHGVDFPHRQHENSLSERFNELHSYTGKIVSLRSIAPAGRIAKAVEHRSGVFYHQRFTPNAVGIMSPVRLLTGGLELAAEEHGRFFKRDVEYCVEDVVHPKTFEPLFVAEVFEPVK